MGARDDEAAARAERARLIGLFRYGLIREAADPGHSTRVRGRLVRAVAAGEHLDPTGRRVRVSRDTLDRWIRAWRRGGFDALVPSPRQCTPRLPGEVVEMAVALKREGAAVRICARRLDAARAVASVVGVSACQYPPAPGSWDVLVNATPAGARPGEKSPMDGVALDGEIVFDLIYAPPETPLIAQARAASGSVARAAARATVSAAPAPTCAAIRISPGPAR